MIDNRQLQFGLMNFGNPCCNEKSMTQKKIIIHVFKNLLLIYCRSVKKVCEVKIHFLFILFQR